MKTKVMLYSTEDNRIGYKKVKFQFKEGQKIVNRETSKVMECLGCFEISESSMKDVHFAFQKIVGKRAFMYCDRVIEMRSALAMIESRDNGTETWKLNGMASMFNIDENEIYLNKYAII